MRFPDSIPRAEPPAPPPPHSLADQAWARIPPAAREDILRRERETSTRVARTKATLALHQLALDHQADDAAAQDTMADDGEGWRDQSMARFDARATPLLAALAPELAAEFAPHLASLRDRHAVRSETHQATRRGAWARKTAAALIDAALARIGDDPDRWPDEHAGFAAHADALPLDEADRAELVLDADGAFRQRAAEAHVDAGRDDAARAAILDPDGAIHPAGEAMVDGMVMRRDAERQQRSAAERLAVAQLIQDDVDAVRRGEAGADLHHDRVAAMFGPDAAERWLHARRDARAHHANTADLALLPEAEMVARLAALAPAPIAGPEPTEADHRRIKLHGEVGQAFDRMLMLRRTDPAAAVREAAHLRPLVAALDPQKPETVQALVAATLAAQVAAGLPPEARRALTKDEARLLATPMIDGARELGRASDTSRTRTAADGAVALARRLYGPHAGPALHQLLAQMIEARPAAVRIALDRLRLKAAEADQATARGQSTPSAGPTREASR